MNDDSLPNDVYGHVITMTTDKVKDTYSVGGGAFYSFPAGTPQEAAYLSMAKQWHLKLFNSELSSMIDSHYTLETRSRWMSLYLEFRDSDSSPNKLAYVKQLLEWGLSISRYTNNYVIDVMSLNSPEEVLAKKWDFSEFDASDPRLTLIACMQIVD